ncbi:MAG: hypothetical protein ACT4TC_01030 [Myxococcaceae bacterium]
MSARTLIASIGALLVLSCAGRPEPQCSVGRASIDGSTGSHTALLTLKDGEDATRPCAQLSVLTVGLQKLYPADNPAGVGSVVVQTETAGKLVKDKGTMLVSGKPNAVGKFAGLQPGADNFCDVIDLQPSTLLFAGLTPTDPQENYTWAWSSFRIFNTDSIPGTYFTADLAYTVGTCTANYSARAIWPVTDCENADGAPDDSLCANKADVIQGIGSKINPLFPTRCHPTAMVCVLNGEVQTK